MTALLVAHQFPWPPIPCSPHAALTPSWTGRTLGIFLVAILTTPVKCKPIVLMTVTALMDTKYELAHTQRSVLTHGPTRSFRALVPWLLPSSSVTTLAFSSSAVLTTSNQIITPECPQVAFWISQPFSGFLSIATYIGTPWLIQWPPCPYHRDMDSSMQISSDGKNLRLVFIEIFDEVMNKSPAVLL